jgi:SNF2 family DNA or RNA helicase
MFCQVCNHPRLCYPDTEHFWGADVVRTCGKMFWLDQMLVKLYASGHRVLLFSTMTKMLDTVEFYLNWREVGREGLAYQAGFDGPICTAKSGGVGWLVG